MLPYNMTYFPNKHATSADDADIILEQVGIYICHVSMYIMLCTVDVRFEHLAHFR